MPVLCLVPTSLRAARAARRLCDAQDGILFGPRVMTPQNCVPGLLAAAGERRTLLTPLAERLLALEASRAAGHPFGRLTPSSGLGRSLASSLAELRSGKVSVASAESAAKDLDGRPAERLHGLAAVLRCYEEALLSLRVLDRPGAMGSAAEALRRGAVSEETAGLDLLVLEGFSSPSAALWDLLAALVERAERTVARVPHFPERPDLSRPAEVMVRRLESLHELAVHRDIEVGLRQLEEGRAPALTHLLQHISGGTGSPGVDGNLCVRALAGAGEQGEAEVAARLAAEMISAGRSPDDLAFIVSSSSRLVKLLGSACRELGVPFGGGWGTPLAETASVRIVREALACAGRFTRSSVESLLGSTYLGSGLEISGLGRLLDRSGSADGRNDPEEALRRRAQALGAPAAAAERSAVLHAARRVSELRALLRPFSRSGTPTEHAARLRVFVSAAGIGRRAARAESEVARRDLMALEKLEETSEDLKRSLDVLGRGLERLDSGTYGDLLEAALQGVEVPPWGEPIGGAVELWPLAEAPGLDVRSAILVGCGSSTLPPVPGPEPFLRDPERLAVNQVLRRAALATSSSRRAEALYQTFSAMAAGRETLSFTWAAEGPGGDGGPLAPVVIEALALAGVSAPAHPSPDPALGKARSESEVLRAAARLFSDVNVGAAQLALQEVSPALALRVESVFARRALEVERQAAVEGRRADLAAGLVPETLAEALARTLPVEWTATQLELFANCPYQSYLRLLVKLPGEEAGDLDLDPRDEGTMTHAIMERFVRVRCERGAWPLSGGEEDKAEAREIALRTFVEYGERGRVGDPVVWATRKPAILARLDRIVEAEAREGGRLRPELIEYRFGGDSGQPPLAFDGEAGQVLVQGRIDRVDASPDALLVIDYKNGRNVSEQRAKLKYDALGVTNFQVPLYLLAASRRLPGRGTLAATYFLLRSAARVEPRQLEAGDPLLVTEPGLRAAVRAAGGRTAADAVLAAVEQIRRGEFPIVSRDCSRCGMGAVCRFESKAEVELDRQ